MDVAVSTGAMVNPQVRAASTRYRQVWGDINKAEKYLGFPLVVRSRGGPLGGTMVLTERGTRFLHAWEKHCRHVANAVEVSYKKYISDIINQPKGEK